MQNYMLFTNSVHMSIKSASQDSCASWFYLAACSITSFFVTSFLESYGVLMVFLIRQYNESNGKTAWVGSLSIFCNFGLLPITLHICNRFGFRIALLLASALVACACLVSPMAPSINYFFLTFSVPFGIAASIIECTVLVTIFDWFKNFRGLAFGVRIGVVILGTMMYAFLLPKFMDTLGWTWTFWAMSGISVTILFLACIHKKTPTNTRNVQDDNVHHKSGQVTAKEDKYNTFCKLMKGHSFLLILTAMTIHSFVVLMPPMFMVQYATNLGVPISKAKYLIVIRVIASVITRFTSGFLGDVAFKYRKVGLILTVDMILCSLATLLCSLTEVFNLLLLYMGVVAVLESVHWTMLPLFAIEVSGSVHADRAYALISCVDSIAMLIGLPVLGVLYDKTGDFNTVLYTTSAFFALASFFLCVGLSKVPVPRFSETLTISQDSLNMARMLSHTGNTAFYNQQYITTV